MQRYHVAVDHPNQALAVMIAEGERQLAAVLSDLIALIEEAVLRQHDDDAHQRRAG